METEESSNRRGGGVIVLVLVLMALASLQGVSSLVSDNAGSTGGEVSTGEPEGAGVAVEPSASVLDELLPSPEPSPSPEPEPDEGVDVAGLRFLRVTHPYPKVCLRPVSRPTVGKLAAYQGGMVSIVAPGSDSVVRISTRKPIAWSPSGAYLATWKGDLYRPSGKGVGSLLNKGSSLWAWSTVADCAVAMDGSGLSVDGPNLDNRLLFELPGIEDLSFSPDGQSLAFVLRNSPRRSARSIWIADLAHGSARRVKSYTPRTPVVRVLGWTSDSKHLFYGIAAGESIAADGVPLRYAAARGSDDGRTGLTVLADDSFLTHCGESELVVAGGARETNTNKRLAFLTSSGPRFITPTSAAVVSPTCSPDGGYIAAVASGDGDDISARRLALLRADGSFERFLAPEGSGDEYPLWGPPGTGLSFIRIRPSGRMADVWFIAEGASARPTPLAVALPANDHGTYDWPSVFTWSATP